MSRIGKKPIPVADGVEITVSDKTVTVKGKNGELTWTCHKNMELAYDADAKVINVTRPNDQRENRALHGLTRSLINNMVEGVQKPYEKKLEIIGVGYNATIKGKNLDLQVGFANTISVPIPDIVKCVLTDPTHITLTSPDKHAVGQLAANIRRVRPPEPYKGKGIRYLGEHIKRKAGKAFASGG
jgi:large subunit ribosomal protein L6